MLNGLSQPNPHLRPLIKPPPENDFFSITGLGTYVPRVIFLRKAREVVGVDVGPQNAQF
jgi:hypothetical protein